MAELRQNHCRCGQGCSCCRAEQLGVNCGCDMEAKQYEYDLAKKFRHEEHNSAAHAAPKAAAVYSCPMHHEVRKTEPGKCPGCGMDLIPEKNNAPHQDHDMQSMSHLDHEAAMTNPAMAKQMEADMRRRFWVSFLLSIPIFLYSPVGVNIFKVHLPSLIPVNWLLLVLTTPIVFWTGSIFITGSYYSLKARKLNMAVLIATGVLAAYLFSILLTFIGSAETFYEAAALLVTFVLFGHWMEMRSRRGTSDALRALFDLVPPRASVVRGGRELQIPSAEIIKGDLVVLRAGDRVPVDGEITQGESTVDESLVTGESIPVAKTVGDEVIGGSVNVSGVLKFKADKVGAETVLAQIIKMVETAQNSKAPGQRLADKWAGRLVILAVGSGIVTFLAWYFGGSASAMTALTFAISAVVIACPDALGLATPTAVAVGTGLGAKHNILIKDAATLENTSRLDAIVLDKTGTLTEGKPKVTDVTAFNGFKMEEVLQYEASIESGSNHPIAKAIVDEAGRRSISALSQANFESIAGGGLKAVINGKPVIAGTEKLLKDNGVDIAKEQQAIDRLAAQGKTLSLLAIGGELAGVIAVADTVKPSSQRAIGELKRLGLEVAMITGDNKKVAEAVGKDLGIERIFAQVLPQDKARYVKKLQDEGRFVAMVGDGINDAPALAQADIGIAIGAGTDVAIETGNIVLMKSDPYDIVSAIRLSRATVRKMKQNLFWAAIYNILAIPVAAGLFYKPFGLALRPEIAALLMSASSIIVATNAVLLKRIEPQLKDGKPPHKGLLPKTAGIALFVVLLTATLFNFYLSSKRRPGSNGGEVIDHHTLGMAEDKKIAEEIIPDQGIVLPVSWGRLVQQMTASGVIDKSAAQQTKLSTAGGSQKIRITPENANMILNLLWALGLSNKNPILETGPMQDQRYGGPANFASTAGWTLAKGDSMAHYSRHQFLTFSPKQQAMIEEISKNIYRSCCDNSTHFPDCNHGMAMLGFLELAASQKVSERDIYQAALTLNRYWFPATYLGPASYADANNLNLSPKAMLGAKYSSQQASPLGQPGSCGV